MYANAQVDIRGNLTRRSINLASRRGFGAVSGGTFDVSFSADKATFTECHYMRFPICVTREPTNNPYTITGADGDIYLGIRLNTQSGDVEIIEGASFDDVRDTSLPANPEFCKRPLYKIRKTTSTLDQVTCFVVRDYRFMIDFGMYV